MNIGILALQGNFSQHINIIKTLSQNSSYSDIRGTLIHSLKDLESPVDGIILPGGESSTIITLLHTQNLFEPLQTKITNGLPVLATCAGAILLAEKNENHNDQNGFATAQISVQRNAYGRQLQSTYAELDFFPHSNTSDKSIIKGMFIRAPRINIISNKVSILANYEYQSNIEPVIVQDRNMLISTFHPEVIGDTTLHTYFIDNLVKSYKKNN